MSSRWPKFCSFGVLGHQLMEISFRGPVEEAKIIPEWLKDTAIGGEASHNDNVLDQAT